MSTDYLYYPGQTLKLGVDGMVPFAPPTNDDCCAYTLCMSEEQAACSFLDLLPTGPLWDGTKTKVRQQIIDAGGIPPEGFDCASMVTYAAYLGLVLKDIVDSTIGVSIRESEAYTAVNYDAFLARLNWQDCYRSACRSAYLAQFSPYELLDPECKTSEYCPTAFPVAFENALKHAIIVSLTRAQRGFIHNLDGINWVIAPLGAVLQAGPYPDDVQECLDNGAPCTDCYCEEATFTICNVGNTIPGAPTVASFCGNEPPAVAARHHYTCGGADIYLYPAVIAAECIVRAYLPAKCPNILYRCDGIVFVPNDPPVDGDEVFSVTENTSITRPASTGLLANASDPNPGAVLTISGFAIAGQTGPFIVGAPYVMVGIGSLTINSDGSFTFAPAPNYSGPVPVTTYVVSDGQGATDTSTLTFNMVNVPNPPEAFTHNETVTEDVTISRDAATGLLSDAIDNEGARTLLVQSFNVAGRPGPFVVGTPYLITGVGTLTILANGAYSFAPATNFAGGIPNISYTIVDTDNGLTDTANLVLTMLPVNDPPVDGDEHFIIDQDETLTRNAATGLLANTVDPDGGTPFVVSYTLEGIAGTRTVGVPYVIPDVGTITIMADGAFTFNPLPTFSGDVPAAFYTVSDGMATDTSTLTIVVVPDLTPPVGAPSDFPHGVLIINTVDEISFNFCAIVFDEPNPVNQWVRINLWGGAGGSNGDVHGGTGGYSVMYVQNPCAVLGTVKCRTGKGGAVVGGSNSQIVVAGNTGLGFAGTGAGAGDVDSNAYAATGGGMTGMFTGAAAIVPGDFTRAVLVAGGGGGAGGDFPSSGEHGGPGNGSGAKTANMQGVSYPVHPQNVLNGRSYGGGGGGYKGGGAAFDTAPNGGNSGAGGSGYGNAGLGSGIILLSATPGFVGALNPFGHLNSGGSVTNGAGGNGIIYIEHN